MSMRAKMVGFGVVVVGLLGTLALALHWLSMLRASVGVG